MIRAALLFAILAALLHVVFFLLESVFWDKPAVKKAFGQNSDTVEITRLLAFNQGFYNLFLAVGTLCGVVLLFNGNAVSGKAAITFGCGNMLGASLVLLYSKPDAFLGVLVQGLPPAFALALLWLA